MRMTGIFKGFTGAFLLLLLGGQSLFAQINLQLNVETYDKHPIQHAELLVQQGDSTILFSVLEDPNYILTLPKAGRYNVQLASLGYETFRLERDFSTDSVLNILLDKPITALDQSGCRRKNETQSNSYRRGFQTIEKGKGYG